MFRVITAAQWKNVRAMLLLFAVIAFALPLASVRMAGVDGNARSFLDMIERFGNAYALLAAALGLVIATSAWASDQRGRHVYALTLPVDRWRYVAMRFTAGLVLLIPPTMALLIGCLIASRSGSLPVGLHGYPISVTLRFALAAVTALALFFAVSTFTSRAAAVVIGLIGVAFVIQIILRITDTRADFAGFLGSIFLSSSGLFGVFGSRWMLIDV